MGCGCGKKVASMKEKRAILEKKKKNGNIIRKRRVSKLISIPGRSSRRKVKGN